MVVWYSIPHNNNNMSDNMTPIFQLHVTMYTEHGSQREFVIPHYSLPPDVVAFLSRIAAAPDSQYTPMCKYDPATSPVSGTASATYMLAPQLPRTVNH